MHSKRAFDVTPYPSANFNDRVGNISPRFIIIHFTQMEPATAALTQLCDPVLSLSAHYLIEKTGTIFQLVDEAKRAWHAGQSYWGGITDLNSHSIGIELDNNGTTPFDEPLYAALGHLLLDLKSRYHIPAENILGHDQIAPLRKYDPGPWFDWGRLDRLGITGVRHIHPQGENLEALLRDGLTQIGYDPHVPLETLLRIERMRQGITPYFTPPQDRDLGLFSKADTKPQ